MVDAFAYMYPKQRDDGKNLLDFLREDSVITPTVTTGTIGGSNHVGPSEVTKTNADMTGCDLHEAVVTGTILER